MYAKPLGAGIASRLVGKQDSQRPLRCASEGLLWVRRMLFDDARRAVVGNATEHDICALMRKDTVLIEQDIDADRAEVFNPLEWARVILVVSGDKKEPLRRGQLANRRHSVFETCDA